MFTQQAAVVYKMAVSCITTQLIVYQPVDGPSSVSKSGMKSLSHMQSLAYGSSMNNQARGSWVGISTYPGGTPAVLELGDLSQASGGAGGVTGLGGAFHDGGAPVPLRLQRVCGFFAVPFWQGRQPSIWVSRTIAGCLSIAVFTLLCLRNKLPCFFSSRTFANDFLISCCVSSIAAHGNPSLAILAIFKARRMSDCSRSTWPPCLDIVADTLKTYKKLVAASRVRIGCHLNHIRLHSLL